MSVKNFILLLSGGGGGVTYYLDDEFTTSQAAPMPASLDSDPGPGLLKKFADGLGVANITSQRFKIPSVTGDLDPAYYLTQEDGSSFPRATGRALIVYAEGAAWVGWSNSATLATAALKYGAKERSAYDAGSEFVQALPIGDPVHIIVLDATGAWHFCRVGTTEYRCWRYPSGTDATLWPAILGSVCDYDSLFVYDVTLPAVTSQLAGPIAQGDTFTHPVASFYFEVTVTTRSGTADTYISVARLDDSNRMFLVISPAGAMTLYKVVAGAQTTEKVIFGNGVIVSGSRIIIQWTVPSQLVSSSGNAFKVWCGSSFYDSNLSAAAQTLLNANSGGVISVKPANCTLNNLITASLT